MRPLLLLLFYACGFGFAAVLGGKALIRRFHWTYLATAWLAFATCLATGVAFSLIDFGGGNEVCELWIENLGVFTGLVAVGSFIAFIYFVSGAMRSAFNESREFRN